MTLVLTTRRMLAVRRSPLGRLETLAACDLDSITQSAFVPGRFVTVMAKIVLNFIDGSSLTYDLSNDRPGPKFVEAVNGAL